MKLVGTDGTRYYSFALAPGSHVLGRNSDCDLPMPSRTVSRQHAVIEVSVDGQTVTVTDQGSHNGTFLNGRKVTGSVTVKIGDRLIFGDNEFKITDADETAVSGPATFKPGDDRVPEKSVFLSINDALKPLPGQSFPALGFLDLTLCQRLFFIRSPKSSLQAFFVAGGILIDILILNFPCRQIHQVGFAGFKYPVEGN